MVGTSDASDQGLAPCLECIRRERMTDVERNRDGYYWWIELVVDINGRSDRSDC